MWKQSCCVSWRFFGVFCFFFGTFVGCGEETGLNHAAIRRNPVSLLWRKPVAPLPPRMRDTLSPVLSSDSRQRTRSGPDSSSRLPRSPRKKKPSASAGETERQRKPFLAADQKDGSRIFTPFLLLFLEYSNNGALEMHLCADVQLSFPLKTPLDSHRGMDTNEFAVLKLLLLCILGE